VGIASVLPSGVGFLMEKEINILADVIDNPKHPFVVILGGAKVSDKIGVINNLVNIADKILVCGGMSYTFIKALGYEIGSSLLDQNSIDFCKNIMELHKEKIIIPKDVVVSREFSGTAESRVRDIDTIVYNEMGMDIGPETIKEYANVLRQSKTILWNGPAGVFEFDKFAVGTKKLLEVLSRINATVVIGGGDTAAAAIKFGYQDKFTRISTGGGATLNFLEGKDLPGVAVISDK
jgi:phosphoglycerate kinase